MNLRKYHALGNDFLIALDQPVDDELARAACDRHRGAGADGLIGCTPDLRMTLYNADGSRAETSGNGLRCLARAVVDAGWQAGPRFTITTDAGPRPVTMRPDGTVTVGMGTPRVDGEQVNMGNPHRVVFVDALDNLAGTGPAPPDENVEFVTAGPGTDHLTMRVFERGVGETQACGSGACAAAAVAHAKGLVGERVTVHQPGGDVIVDLSGGRATLTGPAEFVCEVNWPWR
jgi:diaminopimelate epimerase